MLDNLTMQCGEHLSSYFIVLMMTISSTCLSSIGSFLCRATCGFAPHHVRPICSGHDSFTRCLLAASHCSSALCVLHPKIKTAMCGTKTHSRLKNLPGPVVMLSRRKWLAWSRCKSADGFVHTEATLTPFGNCASKFAHLTVMCEFPRLLL